MSRGRITGTGIAFEQRLRRRIVLTASVLIGLVSSVPSASATLTGEAASIAGPTVESVPVAPNAAPSLPSATPPAPIATPAAPQAPVKLPTEAPPKPSPSPPNSGVDVPSVDGIASPARNSAGSVTSTGKETTIQAATSARSDGSRPRSSQAVRMQAQAGRPPRAIGTAPNRPPSIAAADVAALQRWFARIWPAIPLGSDGTGRGWVARAIGGDLLRPAVAATARLLFLVQQITRTASDSPFVGHPRTANAPQLALPNAPAPADGRKIVHLVILSALLAFLVFPIWREFRSALRPGVH